MSGTEICSEYEDPTGMKGYVVQRWEPETATYVMVDALLTDARWIPHDPPMVPGKGIPAFAYFTMRVMKLHRIAARAIRKLVVCGNHHVESVLQLAKAERAGVALDEAVTKTTSYLSVETPMIQSSHRVVGVRVVGGTRDRLAALLEWHATGGSPRRRAIGRDRSAEHRAMLDRFSMLLDDVVLYDYEMHLDLAPWEE